MPLLDVDENIKQCEMKLEQMTQELFRLQGVLQTFKGFQSAGLSTIELPKDPNNPDRGPESQNSTEDLESVQEKPE